MSGILYKLKRGDWLAFYSIAHGPGTNNFHDELGITNGGIYRFEKFEVDNEDYTLVYVVNDKGKILSEEQGFHFSFFPLYSIK